MAHSTTHPQSHRLFRLLNGREGDTKQKKTLRGALSKTSTNTNKRPVVFWKEGRGGKKKKTHARTRTAGLISQCCRDRTVDGFIRRGGVHTEGRGQLKGHRGIRKVFLAAPTEL